MVDLLWDTKSVIRGMNLQGLYIYILIGLISLSLLFQNCGKQFKAATEQSPLSSFCKASQPTLSPFEIRKVHWPVSPLSSASAKLSTSGAEVVVVVDHICLENQTESPAFFDHSISISEEIKNLKTSAQVVLLNEWPTTEALEIEANKNPCIIGVSDNKKVQKNQSVTTNDPQSPEQRHLNYLGFWQSLALQRQITAKVRVAIVDSGIDYTHQDIRNQMWQDAQGRYGANFASTTITDPRDDDGHGTHVAGIIAAQSNNAIGVSGLTTGYVELISVKVLDQRGAGTSQAVYNGIQYAITNQADIINISLEAPGANALLESAIIDAVSAGIVVTIAAGNQGEEITSTNLYAPAYIGRNLEGAITVASMDVNTSLVSFFSNFSTQYVELAAPGAELSSNQTGILSTHLNNTYRRVMGTSQAAPMVASASALIIGYLKTRQVPYTAAAVESFIKTGGVAQNNQLINSVNTGHMLQIGFLAQSLEEHFASTDDPDVFNGDNDSGRTCIIQ